MAEEQAFDYQKALNDLEVEIHNSISGYNVPYKGFKAIRNLIQKEKNYWEGCKNHQGIISDYIEYFTRILGILEKIDSQNNSFTDLNSLNQHWNNAKNQIINNRTNNGNEVFYSEDPYGKFLFNLAETNTEQAFAAFNAITKKQYNLNNIPDRYFGFMKAYEFLMQGESEIVSRRKLETKTFESLRNEFEQTTNVTVSEFEALKKQMDDWSKKVREGHLAWQNTNNEELGEFYSKREETLNQLEQTYKELLRLKAPAKFWKVRADHYRCQGRIWTLCLAGVISIIVAILMVLIYETPEAFHHNLFKLEQEAIKGIILFASLISFMAYMARVCARMTFSSFHLQRDAEERRQLTYVYLSLIKDGKVDEKDRNLILQSLFSRADTGLLGDDSSPTMPGVGQILDACGKK